MVAITKVSRNPEELLDPLAAHWQSVPAVTLSLKGTPLGTQPTSYTKVVFKGRPVGAVSSVDMRGCHDGTSMFVHLQWADLVENDGKGDGENVIGKNRNIYCSIFVCGICIGNGNWCIVDRIYCNIYCCSITSVFSIAHCVSEAIRSIPVCIWSIVNGCSVDGNCSVGCLSNRLN